MMSYSDLIQSLIEKSSKPTVYRHINKKRAEYKMLISQRDAAYILAAERGFDLFKYLGPDEVERIRSIMNQHATSKVRPDAGTNVQTSSRKETSRKRKSRQDKITLNVDSILVQNLPTNLVNEAKEMANIYPIFYILENSIRVFISDKLKIAYGRNWWEDATISRGIKKNVEKRLADDESAKWHGRRKAHPIFYVSTGDLSRIIENNWDYFKDSGISSPQWVNTYITEIIERSRNIVMHCNPLSKRDIERIRVVFRDWMSIVNPEGVDGEFDSGMEGKENSPEKLSQTSHDSVIGLIEKKKADHMRSFLLDLADKGLISSDQGQLKIDQRINHLQGRVLVSLLISYPEEKAFREIYNDVLYPIFDIEGGDPIPSVRNAIKKLVRRRVIEYEDGGYKIPHNKIGEAIDYVEFRIESKRQ
jgi:hypothetical protein